MNKYALLLNDMRSSNIENIQIVKISDSKQELIDWYQSQLVDELYVDPGAPHAWRKIFKKGSELEWYNPIYDLNKENDYWGGIWSVDESAIVGQGLYKW